MSPSQPPSSRKKNRSGVWAALLNEGRLTWHLLRDPRVPWYLKLLPVGAVIYALSPLDLMPLNPLDDAALVSAALYFFVELCPRDVVSEYREQQKRAVVDAAWREVKDDEGEG